MQIAEMGPGEGTGVGESTRIRSRTFKGVAPRSLYLLLMSGIPTHSIRAESAWGQPMLRNSRCCLMEAKMNGEGKSRDEGTHGRRFLATESGSIRMYVMHSRLLFRHELEGFVLGGWFRQK